MRSVLWMAVMRPGIVACVAVLTACGGGGGDAAPTESPTNVMPSVLPKQDRYAVYERVITTTAPTGISPTTTHAVRTYTLVNPDGSFTRMDSGTAFSRKTTRRFDSTGKLLESTSLDVSCTYTPPYPSGAPRGTQVGQSFAGSTSGMCASTGGTPYATNATVVGGGQAMETITTPAGTFNTFRYTQHTESSSVYSTGTSDETCWVDTVTALVVRCVTTQASTPSDPMISPTSSINTLELIGYSSHAGAPVGAAITRFVGWWGVSFSGSGSGRCSALTVSTSGSISGSCQTLDSLGAVTSTFTVTGSVDVNGVVSATGSDGSVLNGSLSSPLVGSGTWTRGAATGTWSASHW